MLEMKIEDLGRTNYNDTWEIQKEMFLKRQLGEIDDTLLLTEHTPTITFGATEKYNVIHVPIDSLKEKGIEFFRSRRGGGAAYLGPGQLIGYTIMDIKPYGGVRNFLIMLEEVMIRTAGDFGIEVKRYDVMNPTTEKPYRATWYRNNGMVYVLCTKGIGLQIKNGGSYTHHGFALNVNSGEDYTKLIDPCGFPSTEIKPISMQEILDKKLDIDIVKKSVIKNFMELFENGTIKHG